jgi:hypothetical protein
LEELLALRDLFVNFAKGLEKYRAGPAASRITKPANIHIKPLLNSNLHIRADTSSKVTPSFCTVRPHIRRRRITKVQT